ncbi:hypothetical protein EST38_g1385 [Candolleomyces aberdarensis]|uniref:Uncharacterized protein n=1 Tax=Candolleomyces aberdarensis TaxID=2316362 RepID=A0A4Q2DV53_9AGAR|nr:hypothetical protein EST38_g1385 [Candolleomyces aberdarensis]
MFLRRIPQSLRTARIPPPSPLIHKFPQVSARSLISAINFQPGQLFTNDTPNIASFTSASERTQTVTPQAGTAEVNDAVPALPSIQDYETGLATAFSRKQYEVANPLIAKLVRLYRAEPSVRLTLFHDILQRDDVDQLADETLLDILHLLRSSPYEANYLNPETLRHLLQQRGNHKPIYDALMDIVKLWLQGVTVPSGLAGLQYQPPATIKETFLIIQGMVAKQPQPALNLFNELVEKGIVPGHAVSDFDLLGSGDPRLVMLVGLAKAALHWEWSPIATGCVQTLLKTQSGEHPLVPDLLTEVMTHLVDGQLASPPTDPSTNLQLCLDLIRAAHFRRCPAPEDLIRRFYEIARESDQGAEAEALYHFTRSHPVVAEHYYPPPRGYALGWLMDQCYDSSRYQHLCKVLAKEVVDDRLSLPVHWSPRFIQITASTGNLTHARVLWERFREGKDGASVVGDGDLFLAMVQELTTLIRGMKLKSPPATTGKRRRRAKIREDAFNPDSVEHWEFFLRRVVGHFEGSRKSLHRAPRHVLVCYIRACFLQGRLRTGLRLLQSLARRREVPDIEELNFCLGKIGEEDPQMALKFIRRMDELGVTPNPGTYLSVLDRAKDRGDFVLVDRLAEILFTQYSDEMCVKDLALLSRNLVGRRPQETPDQYEWRLEKILDRAQTWLERRNVPPLQFGVSLAESALQLEAPWTASKIWLRLVRDNLAQEDTEHTLLRTRIYKMLEEHMAQGRVDGDRRMLIHLYNTDSLAGC